MKLNSKHLVYNNKYKTIFLPSKYNDYDQGLRTGSMYRQSQTRCDRRYSTVCQIISILWDVFPKQEQAHDFNLL